jgi:hypothetical protein
MLPFTAVPTQELQKLQEAKNHTDDLVQSYRVKSA